MNGQIIQKKQTSEHKIFCAKWNKLKQSVSGQIEYFSAAWKKQDIQMNHFKSQSREPHFITQMECFAVKPPLRAMPLVTTAPVAQRDELTGFFFTVSPRRERPGPTRAMCRTTVQCEQPMGTKGQGGNKTQIRQLESHWKPLT